MPRFFYGQFVLVLVVVALIFSPQISKAQAPANDDCAGAFAISSLPYSLNQNTRLATVNPSDPVLTCADGGGGKTVWFTYTPASTSVVRISTLGSTPSDYDIALAVFTGACGSLVEVQCNDDAGGTRQSEIFMQVDAGVTYLIHVAEWMGGGPSGGVPTGGDLVFNVTLGQLPSLVSGPKNGSVANGVSLTTDGFPSAPAVVEPGIKEVPLRPVDPPLVAPKNVMPPKGPEGSNYFEDGGLSSGSGTAGRPVVQQSFQGIPQTQFLPPDPIIAVGPNHVLACVNSAFRIWDRAGTVLKTINLSSWFANVRPGLAFSDPRVIYDHFANRWVMIGIDAAQSTTPILLSVSDDDNPLGTWYNWSLPGELLGDSATANFSDHPKLGFDDEALYVSSREFAGARQYSKLRIIGKAQLYANTAGPVTWTDLWGFRDPGNVTFAPDFLEPAITFGNPGVEFLVFSSQYSTGTFFTIWKLINPLTNPTITGVNVPVVAYTSPTSVPAQLGGPTTFNGGGSALWGAVVYRDSSLWAVHSVANPVNNTNSAIHYMRFNPFTNSNLEDAVTGLQGSWYYYPEIMPDADKNLVITYSRSSASEYIGAYVAGRKNTDPPGLSSSVTLKSGEAPYGSSRWGDYMGIALDPIDSSAVWAFTQYAASPSSQWGTWAGKVKIMDVSGSLLAINTTSLNFGTLELGDSSGVSTIEISNSGGDTLVVSNITVSSSHFKIVNPPSLPLRIPTFQTASFGVRFKPLVSGNFADSLVLSSNDPTNPTTKVTLLGTGYLVNPAVRGIMYATTGTGAGSRLFTVDTTTGAVTPVGAYGSGYTQAVNVRVHPTTYQILGLIPLTTNASYVVMRINSTGGDAHPLLPVKGSLLKGMAFRGDTLYIANFFGPIFRINMTTGDTTRVATTGLLNLGGIDFHPLTGELWASLRTTGNIYKISLPSGTPTLIGNTGQGATADIMFDGNGNLYGVTGTGSTTNQLIRINTTTGVGTVIGSMGISSVQAIGMYPDSSTVGVEEPGSGMPTQYVLDQNYPNPFNPTTQIRYGVPEQSRITLTIFNELGQEVRRLVDGIQPPGYHAAIWNGTSSTGATVASGVYLYKLEAVGANGATFVQTKKLLLLK